jgi:hypothetical protein
MTRASGESFGSTLRISLPPVRCRRALMSEMLFSEFPSLTSVSNLAPIDLANSSPPLAKVA